ncbi:MAG: hypothetical protein ABI837_04340 [Acidobacteriota bacterium]
MNLDFITEPELEFAGGARHIDIRFGLMNYGPLDRGLPGAPTQVRVGIVGDSESVQGFAQWIETCRSGVTAKASKQPNLFPRFPGYGTAGQLSTDIITDTGLQRTLREKDLRILESEKNDNEVVSRTAMLFLEELSAIAEKRKADVLVCAIPFSLLKRMWTIEGEAIDESPLDLHDLLKAQAMRLGVPLQLVLPSTYDASKRLRQVRRDALRKPQDEATRAWNMYAALYYKAGGVPWRLVREAAQLTVCYVGVSFFETLDGSALFTSTAQVFNERGEGIILRGGAATVSKDDRQPHLDLDGAQQLLTAAIKTYRGEHKTQPARVVLCKTSSFSADELAGFRAALDGLDIEAADLVNVGDAHTRLFRVGDYPPLRGTLFMKDAEHAVLYTRGSVEFYETYPGMYIPRPLAITFAAVASSKRLLAQELLALTKLNWNNTQFDNSEPIMVTAARKVGHILRYVPPSEMPQNSYSFYM